MAQISQQLNQLTRPQGQLPGQPESNPKKHANAIILRSGKELEGPTLPIDKDKEVVVEKIEKSEPQIVEDEGSLEKGESEKLGVEVESPKENDSTQKADKPYTPPIPFPQRLQKHKLDIKFSRFLEVLKKIHINLPFLDAITEMSSYAIFLKDNLSNKRKLKTIP